ncbi:YggS family pyridoxal phosphate-dependent enzyme [Microbacterium sp. UBA3394]|uniref:YggS family pyridoxal phosphate-dependent enzyme n=1 Tax=Microbacterium sp. UBA3394 TaxID=1946945 RepID=UPI000C4995BF|nr:YggS family pyridoxal phosphate-dependent enzyme [Microbacterium sp. UBA3394]MAB19891.1 YggS family pyridoxal phosphate-dependent enzyme [Microbacterium sp.]MAM54760.1 YggS family pyridoxal phosphate-dependent enzyme [Microbacterium sp.]HAS32167.1 YggS family pyridoxal phosphate-dependent enzyme [Microbacterium sp.]
MAEEGLAQRLAHLDARVAEAARAVGRSPAELTRIVVTKFHPASLVTELYGLGVRDVGENRQQEFSAKAGEIGPLDGLRWHFIGQAQTKKARAIRAAASVVHSVDREKLADALDRAGEALPPLDVLVQVNLTDDPGRGGVAPGDLERLAEHVAGCETLALRGVMAVAPLDVEPASAFATLAGYAERVRSVVPTATWMSAGMTADFAEAIAAGATHLRIGSAITGPRPDHG